MARMPAAALALAVVAALLCGAAAQPASCPANCDLPQCPCYQACAGTTALRCLLPDYLRVKEHVERT